MGQPYNFSAGPGILPRQVLQGIQEGLLNYGQSQISILEMSHRGSHVRALLQRCKSTFLMLLDLPKEHYEVLFLHGGASTAFYQIPMNLLSKNSWANIFETGIWVEKAAKEADRFGNIHISSSSRQNGYKNIPKEGAFTYHPKSVYTYLCSNNTIVGTQWASYPTDSPVPLVGDFSSDLLCRRADLSNFGIVFASLQKNLGPAGLAVMAIRRDLLGKCSSDLPLLCSYKAIAEQGSCLNTPPVFQIYALNLVLNWIAEQGGVRAVEAQNRQKASLLYEALDRNDLYEASVEKSSRSIMNVVFRLPTMELEEAFLRSAESKGFLGLKGHRLVGGVRASIYNAFPLEGVERFVDFLEEFAKNAHA